VRTPGPGASPRCPLCSAILDPATSFGGVDRLHRTAGEFEVRSCPGCGTGVTLPQVAPAELPAFYPAGYGPYDDALGPVAGLASRCIRWWQGKRALARAPLRALDAIPAGTVLDVGCGRGDLGALLVGRGWRVTGIDPSEHACRVARRRGIDARRGTLDDVELEPGAFDAVVFQHSLEHTADPRGALVEVARVLKPGGLVLVTVPNFACWQRRRFGSCWYHLDLPRHRTHFTPAGVRAAFEAVGLQVQALTTSTSAVGLPATLQYRVTGRCLFPSGLALRVASGLCVLLLPVAWLLDRAHGGGDQLHAVARRSL
jgi:2-polyprenyl-3-methyl-5-hydroxy-6-metoxy-1,4-benzoquinol methylase